jgi:hypothetical protein
VTPDAQALALLNELIAMLQHDAPTDVLLSSILAYGAQCAAEAVEERDDARGLARILAHAWRHDSCPPEDVVSQALRFPVRAVKDPYPIDRHGLPVKPHPLKEEQTP